MESTNSGVQEYHISLFSLSRLMFCPTERQAAQSRSPLGHPPGIGPGLWVYAVPKPREGPSDHLPSVTGCNFVLHHSFKCGNPAALGLPWGTEHLGAAGGQQA